MTVGQNGSINFKFWCPSKMQNIWFIIRGALNVLNDKRSKSFIIQNICNYSNFKKLFAKCNISMSEFAVPAGAWV